MKTLGPCPLRYFMPVWRCVWFALMLLCSSLQALAHEVPDDVKLTSLARVEGTQWVLMVRAPLAAMAEADIPFVTADDGFVHQVGERRRYRCARTAPRDCGVRESFSVVTGDGAYRVPSGATRAIFVPGLDRRSARELARLGARLRAAGVRFDGYGAPVDVPAAQRADAARYRELQIARDRNSVAVLLRPAT